MKILQQRFWQNMCLINKNYNFLFEQKKISSINQQQFIGGVAQLVRARDS